MARRRCGSGPGSCVGGDPPAAFYTLLGALRSEEAEKTGMQRFTGFLEATGRFFFRWRNLLFPIIVGGLLVFEPPRPFGHAFWDVLAAAGVVAILAGQTLRVVTTGLDYIKRGGKNKAFYADHLVTGGVYAHCRNPMYVGNLLVAFGLLGLLGRPWAIAVGGAFLLLVYLSIVHGEERYLIERFGDEYRAYCERSPRWLVHAGGLATTCRRYWFDWPAVLVKEYGTIFATLLMTTAVLAWKTWGVDQAAFHRFLPLYIAIGVVLVAFYGTARWLKKGRRLKARGVLSREPAQNTPAPLSGSSSGDKFRGQ